MENRETIIFAKNSTGEVLIRDGNLLSQNLIPMRDIDFSSKKISYEGEVYLSEIEVRFNKNGLQPGIYNVIYARGLHGLEECEYKKVDFSKYPLLETLNLHFGILFGVLW